MNPALKALGTLGLNHDKSVRNSHLAPPYLLMLRHGIHLQPGGAVLVRGRNLPPADA
jgi:hypothetical protein